MKRFIGISLSLCLIFSGTLLGAKKVELLTTGQALKIVFPDSTIKIEKKVLKTNDKQKAEIEKLSDLTLNAKYDSTFEVYIGEKDGKVIRYAVIGLQKAKPKPIKYIVGINPDGVVFDVAVMSYHHKHEIGVTKKKFLDQFKGKSLKNSLRIKKGIDAVTKATISSRSVTKGVRKSLAIVKVFFNVGSVKKGK